MPQTFTFNREVRPRKRSPTFSPPIDREIVRRTFERLSGKALPTAEGPFRDKDGRIERILAGLAPFLGRSMGQTMISSMLLLSPRNMKMPWEQTEPIELPGVPSIRYDIEHIHMTDAPLTAGELVAHSNLESKNELTVARAEELYLFIASLLRRVGLQANIALLRERKGELRSALCVVDPETSRLVSLALPEHPAFNQVIVYGDTEVQGLVLLLKAFNHMKKIRDIGRAGT